ncbi:MAG: hypothetical protein WEB88_01420 [Gemmatimonadota bacterium]
MTFTRTSFAALAVAAVLSAGCYDDPLADGRGEATTIQTNRVETNLTVNRQFTVTARLLDNQFTPLPMALSGSAGSNLRLDSTVYVTELRETRFFVTPTAMLASAPTTLTITGGGLSKTVEILAYPRSIESDVPAELQSGETFSPTVIGFDDLDGSLGSVSFTVVSDDESVVEVGEDGTLIAKGVGLANLTFTGPGGGIHQEVIVNVVPGTFGGGAAATTYLGMQALRITPGTVAFDDDTDVTFPGTEGDVYVVSQSANEIVAVVPFGTPAGTVSFIVHGVGESQLALAGTGTIPSAAVDPWEPANNGLFAGATVTNSGVLVGQVGPSDLDDFFLVEITEPGVYDVTLEWGDGADIDMFIIDPNNIALCSGDILGCGMATAAQPEVGDGEFAVETYLGYVNLYAADGTTDYRVTITKRD